MRSDNAQPLLVVLVGLRVRDLRLGRGYSMRHVAHRASVSLGELCNIEHGRVNASITVLARIARVLEVETVDLFNVGGDLRAACIEITRCMSRVEIRRILRQTEPRQKHRRRTKRPRR